jgi:hypothetical protein
MHRLKSLLYIFLLMVVPAFSVDACAAPVTESGVKRTKEANDPAFHKILLEAAKNYVSWGQVDSKQRFSPILCRPASPGGTVFSPPRISQSDDAGTHGKKVYFLYAKDPGAYIDDPLQVSGQTLVKESFFPKEGSNSSDPTKVIPGEKYALFVMSKVENIGGKNTDKGWIYGTLSPDGKTVTSSGLVQSCMGCHAQATRDRLFGLKPEAP